MAESASDRFARWRLQDLLLRHSGLRIMPNSGDDLLLAGDLPFRATGPDGRTVEDCYAIEIRVQSTFPRGIPTVRETGGRIAPAFHKLEGDLLCLGARTEIQIQLATAPTLLGFVDRLVIPYLFGHSYHEAHGVMPFGELEHGRDGLLQYFASLFRAPSRAAARVFVHLTSLRRRVANKEPCPCGSHRRLGRCHNRQVNRLRKLLGRSWFRGEFNAIATDE